MKTIRKFCILTFILNILFLPYNPAIVVQNIGFACYSELFNDHHYQPNGKVFYESYIDSFNTCIKENIFIMKLALSKKWILQIHIIRMNFEQFCYSCKQVHILL